MTKKNETPKTDRQVRLGVRISSMHLEIYNGFKTWRQAYMALSDIVEIIGFPEYGKVSPICHGFMATTLVDFSRSCQDLPKYEALQRMIFSVLSDISGEVFCRRTVRAPVPESRLRPLRDLVRLLLHEMNRISEALGETVPLEDPISVKISEPYSKYERQAIDVIDEAGKIWSGAA